jgi:hypothetical protein
MADGLGGNVRFKELDPKMTGSLVGNRYLASEDGWMEGVTFKNRER